MHMLIPGKLYTSMQKTNKLPQISHFLFTSFGQITNVNKQNVFIQYNINSNYKLERLSNVLVQLLI